MTSTIALITGSNKGIGFEIARGLGLTGARIIVAGRTATSVRAAAHRLSEEGIAAEHVVMDVTDDETVAAAAETTRTRHGRLDILVNNAGVAAVPGADMSAHLTEVAAARTTFETNVFGVLRVTNAFLPLLRESAAPRVVNVSSNMASHALALDPSRPLTWGLPGSVYAASKAALNRLTVSYAKEFWDSTFKFNTVCPGYCDTDLNGHSGYRTPAEGAAAAIGLALIDGDGPNGGFFSDEAEFTDETGALPW